MDIPVNPHALKAYREDRGYSEAQAAVKAKIKVEDLKQYESTGEIPWTVVKKLGIVYKRPTAAFISPHTPQITPRPTDYRKLPRDKKDHYEIKTLELFRKADIYKNNLIELKKINGELIKRLKRNYDLKDNPEIAAQKEREELEITIQEQTANQTDSNFFKVIREKIEKEGIFVFQGPAPITDLRGFSKIDENIAIIVLNSQEVQKARNFTLMHEYAHILLRNTGACAPDSEDESRGVERWCDRFASTFFLPEKETKSQYEKSKAIRGELIEIIQLISTRMKVSREVVLRRIFELQIIDEKSYLECMAIIRASYKKIKPKGGPERAVLLQAYYGNTYATLTSRALRSGKITEIEACRFFSTNQKVLGEIMATVR